MERFRKRCLMVDQSTRRKGDRPWGLHCKEFPHEGHLISQEGFGNTDKGKVIYTTDAVSFCFEDMKEEHILCRCCKEKCKIIERSESKTGIIVCHFLCVNNNPFGYKVIRNKLKTWNALNKKPSITVCYSLRVLSLFMASAGFILQSAISHPLF